MYKRVEKWEWEEMVEFLKMYLKMNQDIGIRECKSRILDMKLSGLNSGWGLTTVRKYSG